MSEAESDRRQIFIMNRTPKRLIKKILFENMLKTRKKAEFHETCT